MSTEHNPDNTDGPEADAIAKREQEKYRTQQENAPSNPRRYSVISAAWIFAKIKLLNVLNCLRRYSELVIAIASILLFVIAYLQWQAITITNRIMLDTLLTTKLEQRPWVYPSEIRIFGSLEIKSNGRTATASVPIEIVLSNSGKLPSNNAFISAQLFPDYGHFDLASSPFIKGCNRDAGGQVGVTVFPGAKVNYTPLLAQSADWIVREGAALPHLNLGVCTRYLIPGDTETKRLIQWFLLVRDFNGTIRHDFDMGHTPKSALSLRAIPAGDPPK